MAIKFGWTVAISRDNLLARMLRMFYVVPPAVTKPALAHQRNPMMRYNLPASKIHKFVVRARELRDSFDCHDVDLIAANEGEAALVSSDDSDSDSDSDPDSRIELDVTCKQGCKPERSHRCRRMWNGKVFDLFANNYCCSCSCCRSSHIEMHLPRAKASVLLQQLNRCEAPALKYTAIKSPLKVIRHTDNCVLGVLSNGYVVKGSGSLKGRLKKRA